MQISVRQEALIAFVTCDKSQVETFLISELIEFKIPMETGTPGLLVCAIFCNVEPRFVNRKIALGLAMGLALLRNVLYFVLHSTVYIFVQRVDSRCNCVRFSSFVFFHCHTALSKTIRSIKATVK